VIDLKILVTGAEGFTGKHFTQEAIKSGHTIIKLKSDLLDLTELQKEIEQTSCDFVVHLAAISFIPHSDTSEIYKVNVLGTTNLLDTISKFQRPIKRILLTSSASVYGNNTNLTIDESHLAFPINHYACSKLSMEYMALTYTKKLPIFITRPFNYIGPGQNKIFVVPKIVDHFKRGAKTIDLGDLNVEREFNDVRFVCQSYLKLLNNAEIGQIYNICTGKSHNLKKIISLLEDLSSHKISINVNESYIRANEIKHLAGNPTKLKSCTGLNNQYSLAESLKWIFDEI